MLDEECIPVMLHYMEHGRRREGGLFGTVLLFQQLEQERRSLLEQLASVREKLIFTESSLKEKTAALDKVQDNYTKETDKLRQELREVFTVYDHDVMTINVYHLVYV